MARSSSRRRITDDMLRTIIIKRLPRLLEKEPPLRDYLANLLSDKFADKEKTEEGFREMLQVIKEQNKRLEEHSRRLEEHSLAIREMQREIREQNKRLEEQNKRLEEHSKILQEQNKRLEEQSKILQEQNKRLEEHSRRLEEHSLAIREMQREIREQGKRLEEHSLAIKELLQELKSLRREHDRSIGAIGARWGFRTERSFREAMKAILEEDFGVKVESYLAFDKEGEVFGKPDQVELDLIIRNGKTIVIEIKSSVSKGDVSTFYRKIKFYEKTEGRKIDRAMIVSPMVEAKALELAKKFGFEVYGYPEEVNLKD